MKLSFEDKYALKLGILIVRIVQKGDEWSDLPKEQMRRELQNLIEDIFI